MTRGSRACTRSTTALGRGTHIIKISLFGTTCAEVDGRALMAAQLGGRSRQVLALLALEVGEPVGKERLADRLWEGQPPGSYVGTLETYVSVLRRNMGLVRGRGCPLATLPNGYRLDAESVGVDLTEFSRLVSSMPGLKAAAAISAMHQAVALASGELLASEPYANWACRAREQHTRELVTAGTFAAHLANGVGDFRSAELFAGLATRRDPLFEPAWQHLMRSFWFSGRRSEALRAYLDLRTVMLDALGEEPGKDSQELYLAILRDDSLRRRGDAEGEGTEVRTLLLLLRQALDVLPGVTVPARDSSLAGAASALLRASP